MFPPAPIALVDKGTGGVQNPKAGVLGSHDSVTGGPQNFKGEAAEQEASNLVAGVASVAVGSAVGKHDQGVPEDAPLEESVPDATDMVAHAADAQSKAHGQVPSDHHDKTREPMKKSVIDGANMAMQIISGVTDAFEKFEKSVIDFKFAACSLVFDLVLTIPAPCLLRRHFLGLPLACVWQQCWFQHVF